MKKMLLDVVATLVVALLGTSCANDDLSTEKVMNEKKEVNLTTRLDGLSRALTEADAPMLLYYTVYDASTGDVVDKNTAGLNTVSFEGNTSVTLTLSLEKNRTYDMAFWAQPQGTDCYDLADLKAVKVLYHQCVGNDLAREAFYGNLFGLKVGEETSATVSLQSPFSRLEVLTTADDMEAAKTIGMDVEQMCSSIRVSGAADTFNALYGTAEGSPVSVQLLPGKVPATPAEVDGEPYRVLTTDYLLAFRKQPVEVEVQLSSAATGDVLLSFMAGKAWLERGGASTLSSRYLTHPIEFDATVNDWQEGSTSAEL